MESTLAITFPELKARVAAFMGWSRGTDYDEPAWSERQQFEIDGIVASGLRKFYYPAIEELPGGYEWSFLRPVVSLTFPSGAQSMGLPDDFGGLEGKVTVSVSGSTGYCPIPVVGDVRHMYAVSPSATGYPQVCCIDPIRGTTKERGTRSRLMVYPAADQAYTFQFAYYVNPQYLSNAFPHHLGGSQHGETILQSCLAAAELKLDDQRGPQWAEFKTQLLASVNADRKLKPQVLGYNGDASDMSQRFRRGTHDFATITFAGSTYE